VPAQVPATVAVNPATRPRTLVQSTTRRLAHARTLETQRQVTCKVGLLASGKIQPCDQPADDGAQAVVAR
jgi:hypothetical protein